MCLLQDSLTQICSYRRDKRACFRRRAAGVLAERVMEGEGRSDQVCVIVLAPETACPLAFVVAGRR